MKKIRKIVLSAILLLALIGGIYAANSRQILSAISGIKASDSPVITNGFTDKEKYFPGEQMTITAETQNALEVKAFVENEKGYNEVNLVVAASFNGKETWTGKWKVENSLSGKKYKLKIAASNKSGTAEKMLGWEDPNPGHPWSQIEGFPAACGGNDFVKGIGAALTCATPSGGTPVCTVRNNTVSSVAGESVTAIASCIGMEIAMGGGCGFVSGTNFTDVTAEVPTTNAYACTLGSPNSGNSVTAYVVCCLF